MASAAAENKAPAAMKPLHPDWLPRCRWCREQVIRWLPCNCDRAQEEARRVRREP
jgi:hypothetical protein